MTQVGAFLDMTLTVRVGLSRMTLAFLDMTLTVRTGLSHMTLASYLTSMTRLGGFPGSGLLSLTRSDLYETGLTVYKDTVLGDLFPKLLLKLLSQI